MAARMGLVAGLVASGEVRRAGEAADGGCRRQNLDPRPAGRRPLGLLDKSLEVPAAVARGEELAATGRAKGPEEGGRLGDPTKEQDVEIGGVARRWSAGRRSGRRR